MLGLSLMALLPTTCVGPLLRGRLARATWKGPAPPKTPLRRFFCNCPPAERCRAPPLCAPAAAPSAARRSWCAALSALDLVPTSDGAQPARARLVYCGGSWAGRAVTGTAGAAGAAGAARKRSRTVRDDRSDQGRQERTTGATRDYQSPPKATSSSQRQPEATRATMSGQG